MYDTEPGTRPGQERFVAPIDETPLRAIDVVDVDAVPESQWREAWKRLRKSPLFWLASLIILVLAVMVAFPTLFTDVDPYARDASARWRLLDRIRPAFGARGIEPPTCIGNRAKLALRKSRAVARMHTPIVRWSAIRGRPLPRRQPSPDTSSK